MSRSITVELPRLSYYTGEVIEGTVVIETTSEAKSRGLYVDFTGTEETQITRQSGKTSHTYRSTATLVQWRLPLRGGEPVPPGTYPFPVRFQNPGQGPPSYAGRPAGGKYILTAPPDGPPCLDSAWKRATFGLYSA